MIELAEGDLVTTRFSQEHFSVKLELVPGLPNVDNVKLMEFCKAIRTMMEDETFTSHLILSEETTYNWSRSHTFSTFVEHKTIM